MDTYKFQNGYKGEKIIAKLLKKAFKNIDTFQKNYDILGGWIASSPLQTEALKPFSYGTEDISEMLLQGNCYFVIEENRDMDFLIDFYQEKGILLKMNLTKVLGNEGRRLCVYQLEKK